LRRRILRKITYSRAVPTYNAGERKLAASMKNDRWGITLYVLLLLTVVRLWLMPIGSSLGLDETGTYYLATQGWGDYIAGRLPQIQSPLYTAFMHILIVIV